MEKTRKKISTSKPEVYLVTPEVTPEYEWVFKDDTMAEGVVFYNLRRKEEGKIYRAKLRRDMFDWYYRDVTEIHDS